MKKSNLNIFSFLSPVSLTQLINIHSRISPRILAINRIANGPNGILRGLGETDKWKNLTLEILCQTPFNMHS